MPQSIPPAILNRLSVGEFLAATQELGVTELARNLNVGKPSVHRILDTLVRSELERVQWREVAIDNGE